MINQQMVDRYYELVEIRKKQGFFLNNADHFEFNALCEDLLYDIMVENRDVFERLKDR